MKDEFLYLLFEGMESAIILRKNREGSKAWTQWDLRRAYRRGFIQGYDVSIDKDWPTTINMKMVQTAYISDEEVPLDDDMCADKELCKSIAEDIVEGYL